MDYIKVNGIPIPYANSVVMATTPNIIGEVTTLAGNMIGDINGYRYDDATLTWDYLKPEELLTLLEETGPMQGTFEFTFKDPEEGEKSLKAIRVNISQQKTQLKHIDGEPVWTNISMTLRFPEVFR